MRDGLGTDQAGGVEGVGVLLVLRADRRPEDALDLGPLGLQVGERGAVEQVLEDLVGVLAVGDGDLAEGGLQLRLGGRVGRLLDLGLDPLVGLGVDPRDEEAGDRRDLVDRQPGVDPPLEGLDVGVGDGGVGLDAEQEGDVDVHPGEQQFLDRRQPFGRPGDLDHRVRAAEQAPELLAFGERPLGVVGQVGGDFEADVAVVAVGLVVDRLEGVERGLDVGDGERLVDRVDPVPFADHHLDVVVVFLALADRLLEDARVGGHPAEAVLLDQAGQLAGVEHLAADVVEPDAGPAGLQGGERRGRGGGGHGRKILEKMGTPRRVRRAAGRLNGVGGHDEPEPSISRSYPDCRP